MSADKPLSRFHQPISVPGRRLLPHVPLRFVRKQVSGGGQRSVKQDLPLAPFIDCLLCIVLFLRASFSASGELPIDKNVKLPNAENVIDMTDAPMVAITGTQILVDGNPAGSTRAIEESNRRRRVEELFNVLKNKREQRQQLNPAKAFPWGAVLQVDRRVQAVAAR